MKPLSAGLIDNDSLHIRVLYAREGLIDSTWNDQGVCSTYWRYYVNYRDGANVRLHDGTLYGLPSGYVHFVPPWVRIDLVSHREVEHLWAHFDIVGLPGSLIRELFSTPCSLPLDGALKATATLMRSALDHQHACDRPDAIFSVKAAIHCALAQLFLQLPPASLARMVGIMRFDAVIGPALRSIETNLSRPMRVAELARLCNFAQDHFTRVFRREVGQTPGQYILERRVAVAAQKLVLSDASIDLIAEECGFPDRFYFSRVFTKRMGVPPGSYRKANPPPFARTTAP